MKKKRRNKMTEKDRASSEGRGKPNGIYTVRVYAEGTELERLMDALASLGLEFAIDGYPEERSNT